MHIHGTWMPTAGCLYVMLDKLRRACSVRTTVLCWPPRLAQMQHSLSSIMNRPCNTWHTSCAPGLYATVRHRPAAPCQFRLNRCVRSSITRAADPQQNEMQDASPSAPVVEPQQQQVASQQAAAVDQQQQMASQAIEQPPQAFVQQWQAPLEQQSTQQLPNQQQSTAQELQQQPQQQHQQPQQQQQRTAAPVQQKSPTFQQQQHAGSSSRSNSSTRRQQPGWLQRLMFLLQHMPAALAAFLVGGLGACMLLFGWAKGSPMRKNQPYTFTMSFQEASKLDVGTPVRMKGVQIGTVTRVLLSPSHITAYAEVPDQANIIPRTSRVDINLLGLASDPWIDITPPLGCAVKKQHGPHHPECDRDGLIVCHGGHIQGSQGGSTDFMMKFFLSQHDRTRQKTVDVIYHSRNA